MNVAFAPNDERMATLESRPATPGKAIPSIRFALWDIRAPQPDIETSRRTGSIPLSPPADPPGPANNPFLRQPFTARSAAALWVGFDLKVRAMNPQNGEVATIDDVKDALFKTAASGASIEAAARLPLLLAGLNGTLAPSPEAPSQYLPLAASGDGRRALLLAGASARVYALDGQPRLLRAIDLSPWFISGAGVLGAFNVAMSRDGEALAITVLGSKSGDRQSPPRAEDMEASHLVFAPDAAAPIRTLHGELMPVPVGAISRDQIVALGPKARIAVIDQIRKDQRDGRSRATLRAVVRDLASGADILAFDEREITIGPGGLSDADGSSGVMAGLDATGLRVAMARDAPDCPMTIATTVAWMPTSVPSCPERRVKIEVWDLEKRKKISETSFVVTPEGSTKDMPATPSVGFARMAPFAIDLPDASAVTLTGATFHGFETGSVRTLSVEWTQHRVSLSGEAAIQAEACERLPPAFAEPDLSAWMALVPNEAFRPICPQASAAAQRP